MKFLLTTLLAAVATALPPPAHVQKAFAEHRRAYLDGKLAARTAGTQFIQGLEPVPHMNSISNNWCGAVLQAPPSGEFNHVAATWQIPHVKPPVPGPGKWYSSEWVGIDGYTCETAILQAGTMSYVEVDMEANITMGASAWFEWYPWQSIIFPNLDVSPGVNMSVSVVANTSMSATITIENSSTGQSATHHLDGVATEATLCGANAEWILEDFSSGISLVPFSAFADFEFVNCVASTTTSERVNLDAATLVNLRQGSDTLAVASMINGSAVEITYTGPTTSS